MLLLLSILALQSIVRPISANCNVPPELVDAQCVEGWSDPNCDDTITFSHSVLFWCVDHLCLYERSSANREFPEPATNCMALPPGTIAVSVAGNGFDGTDCKLFSDSNCQNSLGVSLSVKRSELSIF